MQTTPAWPVDTPGGRYYAEFDDQAPVTREGQLIFFAQFLHAGGRWARLLRACPLHDHGNHGSAVVDMLGTAALSILCGHWRYAHINAVRGDTLNPPLLGMTGTVSEDVVRRAMKRIDEATGLAWLAGELRGCVEPVLRVPWIAAPAAMQVALRGLSGKALARQAFWTSTAPSSPSTATSKARRSAPTRTAERSETARPISSKKAAGKPGRPSHCYHSYFMASTRMCLGVEVCGGKAPALAPVGANARRRRDHLQPTLAGSADWAASTAPWSGKIAVLVTSLDAPAYPTLALARLYRRGGGGEKRGLAGGRAGRADAEPSGAR